MTRRFFQGLEKEKKGEEDPQKRFGAIWENWVISAQMVSGQSSRVEGFMEKGDGRKKAGRTGANAAILAAPRAYWAWATGRTGVLHRGMGENGLMNKRITTLPGEGLGISPPPRATKRGATQSKRVESGIENQKRLTTQGSKRLRNEIDDSQRWRVATATGTACKTSRIQDHGAQQVQHGGGMENSAHGAWKMFFFFFFFR